MTLLQNSAIIYFVGVEMHESKTYLPMTLKKSEAEIVLKKEENYEKRNWQKIMHSGHSCACNYTRAVPVYGDAREKPQRGYGIL